MPNIKLKSSDGEIFEIDVQVAKLSGTLKTMLQDCGMEEVIPLPKISAGILHKVIQWANHHKDDPPSQKDDSNEQRRTDDIPQWDDDFFNEDHKTYFELLKAGHYLHIADLIDVIALKVAKMITAEYYAMMSGIRNHCNPEEEALLILVNFFSQ